MLLVDAKSVQMIVFGMVGATVLSALAVIVMVWLDRYRENRDKGREPK